MGEGNRYGWRAVEMHDGIERPPIDDAGVRESVASLYRQFGQRRSAAVKCLRKAMLDERFIDRRERLFDRSLREVAFEDAHWCFDWLHGQRDCSAALLYVLPRVCEFHASEFGASGADFYQVCATLDEFDWTAWREDDLAAVRRFLKRLWAVVVRTRSRSSGNWPHGLLFSLSFCESDYSDYFAEFHSGAEQQVICNLASVAEGLLPRGAALRPGGKYMAQQTEQLIARVVDPAMQARFQQVYELETEPYVRRTLLVTAALVEHELSGR